MSVLTDIFGGAAQGAATGAIAGAPIGGIGAAPGAIAGALIGGIGGFFGGRARQEEARAQAGAAEAQLAEARRQREIALGMAGASPVELEGQRRLLDLQNQVLGRTNRELEFLSQGLAARTNGASLQGEGLYSQLIAQNRAAQRQNLEATLRARFGAGYATSSAGMQALNQFDAQTVQLGVEAVPQFLRTAYTAIEQPMTFENALASRQINALTGNPVTPYVGAPFVGQIQEARGTQQGISDLFRGVGQLATSYSDQQYRDKLLSALSQKTSGTDQSIPTVAGQPKQ